MKRRKLLVGIAGLSGAAGAIGTGAFTGVEADRSVSVSVEGDADAYLALEPYDGPNGNGQYAALDGGELTVDLDAGNAGNVAGGGEGVNAGATTRLNNVFSVRNQGTQPVGVYVEDASDAVTFESRADGAGSSIEGADNAVTVDTGKTMTVDLVIDVEDESGQLLDDASVVAEAGATGAPGGGEATTLYVDDDGNADYDTIGAALDAASEGMTVQVADGDYQENVVVDTPGVTLRGAGGSNSTTIESTGTDDVSVQAPLEVAAEGVAVHNVEVEGASGGGQKDGVYVGEGPNVVLDGVRVHQRSGYDEDEFNTGIGINNVANVTVRNCEVHGESDMDRGIRLYPGPNSTVEGCTVTDCNRAIEVEGGNIVVADCEVHGITADSPDGWYKDPGDDGLDDETFPDGKGIRVEPQAFGDVKSDNTIQNNVVESCATGIELDGSDSEVAGNELLDCTAGVSVSNGAATHTITDNAITGGSERGISVYSGSTDSHTIENNTVSDHGVGIVLSGADDNTVVGNSITGCTYNGIWLNDGSGGATGNLVEDNVVSDNGYGAGAPYPAVIIQNGSDNEVSNNDVDGNSAQGIYAYGTTGTVVDGNTVENNGAGAGDFIYSGMYLEEVSDIQVTNNTLVDNHWRGIYVYGYSNLTMSGNDVTLRYPDYYEAIVTEESTSSTSTVSTTTAQDTDGSAEEPTPAPGGIEASH